MPRSRTRNPISLFIDSFISSVHRTGGGSSWVISFIFLIGGAFSLYVGYTSPSLLLMFGGGITMLIGFMLTYRVWYSQNSKKRKGRT